MEKSYNNKLWSTLIIKKINYGFLQSYHSQNYKQIRRIKDPNSLSINYFLIKQFDSTYQIYCDYQHYLNNI